MAIVLSLFSDAEMRGESNVIPASGFLGVSSCVVSAVPADAQVLNPCKDCSLRGLCSDECAAHSFPLDVPWSYGTRFHNLGEYVNMLKHYGWL